MEDDDEFGDLYTDVLRPFASSSSSTSFGVQNHQPPINHSVRTPVDLNRQRDDVDVLFRKPYTDSAVSVQATIKTLPPMSSVGIVSNSVTGDFRKGIGVEKLDGLAVNDSKVQDRAPQDGIYGVGSGISGIRNQAGLKEVDFIDNDMKFDIEEGNTGAEVEGLDPIIPGLSTSGSVSIHGPRLEGAVQNAVGRASNDGDDDWDSDSEDDLQIVLNDNSHGHMTMERGGMGGDDDDEDEDGAPLVIVADGDPNQPMEEQDWVEDAVQGSDAERKEMGEAHKASGGMALTAKIGYSSHGYHPFHSQFKYVRPGAAPIPSTPGLGGAPGQVRPHLNVSPIGGRGRGDWRPPGIKNAAPMQKGFNSGFGMPAWGNNMAGRGFGGGLEFTLPSHKTIFEVDIDSIEEKPWKYPGVDLSDFFNFGLNEDSWKEYCKQLEQLRLEATMQSKIRVYESGRTEQEYDPDLPPELAAAAGIHDIAGEMSNAGKSIDLQNDLGKGAARLRPQLPAGRAIQVESGYGERLPSIDTRPPRMRDADAVIEIVLQDSVDDDSTGNCNVDQPDNDTSRNDLSGDQDEGHLGQADIEDPDEFSLDYRGGKRERAGIRITSMNSHDIPEGKEASPFPCEGRGHSPNSRGQTPNYCAESYGSPYEERKEQGMAQDQSPHSSPSRIAPDGNSSDNQKEGSVETVDGKQSPLIKAVKESSVEIKDAEYDAVMLENGKSEVEKDTYSDTNVIDNNLNDEPDKKPKISPLVDQSVHEDFNDKEDSKAARSSENSRARSGSSRDNQKWRDGVDEEVVQDRHSTRMGSVNRDFDESEKNLRRKVHDERQVGERSRIMAKVKDDSYPHKPWDLTPGNQLHLKTEGFDRRREGDSDGAWHRRDDASYYGRKQRAEDTRKREHVDEMGSRHRGKVHESEWHDKDDDHLRLDNGNYRIHYDKDLNSRHREREDNLRSRHENVDDYHSKRRKDEEHFRKDYIDREEHLHGLKESSSRRKRERNEVFDPRKRDDLQRIRENVNDYHSTRPKDEWLQRERADRPREREEWQRLKPSYEENMNKREREEGRGAIRGEENMNKREREEGRGAIRGEENVNKREREEGRGAIRGEENMNKREREEGRGAIRGEESMNKREREEGRGAIRGEESMSKRGREEGRGAIRGEENMNKREREEGRGAIKGGSVVEEKEKGWSSHGKVKDDYKVTEKEYHTKDPVRHSEQSKKRERVDHESSLQRGRENVYARGNQLTHEERRSRRERSSSRNDRPINPSDNQRMHDKKQKENVRKPKQPETVDHKTLGPLKRSQEDQSGHKNETGGKSSRDRGDDEHEPSTNKHLHKKLGEDASSDDEQRNLRKGRSKLERWTSHKERDFNVQSKSQTSSKLKDNEKNNNVGSSDAIKHPDAPSKTAAATAHNQMAEDKDAESKPVDDRHLDTVEKLKKRSERFKLPMPSEKEAPTSKKVDNDTLPSTTSEAPPVDSDIKPERPARKRRWISK